MSDAVLKAAREWIDHVEKTKKLNKLARRSVLSFAIWLDSIIRSEERKEEMKHDKEN